MSDFKKMCDEAKTERDTNTVYIALSKRDEKAAKALGHVAYVFDPAWSESMIESLEGKRLVVVLSPRDSEFEKLNDAGRFLFDIEDSIVWIKLPGEVDGSEVEFDDCPEMLVTDVAKFDQPLEMLIDFVRVSDVEDEAIEWLWENRFARGKLNIIAGDGEVSKTTFTCYMAGRCSKGENWPHEEGTAPQGSTIFLTCEDDVADTLKPRLAAAGADLTKVLVLKAVKFKDKAGNKRERMFDLGDDLPRLEALIKQVGDVVEVIIDPLNSYLGSSKKVDSWRGQDIRSVLAPLALLAAKYKIAVIIIAHNTKESKRTAMQMIMGSADIGNIVRAAWGIVCAVDEHGREFEHRAPPTPRKNEHRQAHQRPLL